MPEWARSRHPARAAIGKDRIERDCCAGLLDGLPDGQEEEILQELEERVKAQGAKVKQSKSSTAEVCTALPAEDIGTNQAVSMLAHKDGAGAQLALMLSRFILWSACIRVHTQCDHTFFVVFAIAVAELCCGVRSALSSAPSIIISQTAASRARLFLACQ